MFSSFINNATNTSDSLLKAIITAFYARNWARAKSKMLFNHSMEKAQFLISDVTSYTFKVTVKSIGKDSVYVFNNTAPNTDKGIAWINSFINNNTAKLTPLSKNNVKRLSVMTQRHSDDEVFKQITDSFTRSLKGQSGNMFDSIDADNKYYDDNVYDLERLANQASTSSLNDLPYPTEEQKQNNDYQVGNVEIAGLPIAIENPAGSIRSGVDKDGNVWNIEMKHHYGYIKNTMGNDGDELDVFIKSGLTHFNGKVFIVKQVDQAGNFDEHKLVLGADDENEAKEIYLSNYDSNWTGFGGISEISISELKSKLNQEWGEFDEIGIDLKNTIVDSSNAIQVLKQLMTDLSVTPIAPEKIQDFGEKIGGARKDTVVRISKRIAKIAGQENNNVPTWAKRFEILQNTINNKWTVFDKKKKTYFGGNRVLGEYETQDEAEKALPLLALGMNHRVYGTKDKQFAIYKKIGERKTVQVVEQTFNSRDEALNYMVQNAESILEVKTTYGEIDIPKPENAIRIGKSYREKNATGDDFMESFALRGVEFGNWNNQDERQELLNDAYDGLMDLSSVLGVKPQSLSLGGDLALAFGARGKGLSGASAHYEPSYSVINLTKKNGSGSLAHEWLHAFDHYMGRIDGIASNEWITHNDGTRTLKTKPNGTDFISENMSYKSNLPDSVKEAWKKLVSTILVQEKEVPVDTSREVELYQRRIDQNKKNLENRLNDIKLMLEMSLPRRSRNKLPATAEQMAEFEKYRDKILNGDISTDDEDNSTSNYRSFSGRLNIRRTNESLNKISNILKSVRGTTGFSSQQDGVLNKVSDSMYNLEGSIEARDRYLKNNSSGEENTRTQRAMTDFYYNATSLDQGRGSAYWSTKPELMARVFQGYIEDKIADQGGYSPFLNYAPQSANIPTPWGINFIYPRGEERKRFNKAFDDFFAEIRKHELL